MIGSCKSDLDILMVIYLLCIQVEIKENTLKYQSFKHRREIRDTGIDMEMSTSNRDRN